MPKIDIAIAAWDNWTLTQACLKSLGEHTRSEYRVILIDNGSVDDTKDLQSGGNVFVIRNAQNLGFVTAMNQGLEVFRQGDADYFVMLNNDAEVSPDWDVHFMEHFDRDPRVGAVGPTSGAISERQNTYYNDGRKWESAKFLIYMAVMFSRKAILHVGGLDPLFSPGGSDDLDHSIRMRDAGYRLIIDRRCDFPHVCHASFKRLPEFNGNEYWAKGRKKIEEKWGRKRLEELLVPKQHVLVAVPSIHHGPNWDWVKEVLIKMLSPKHNSITVGWCNPERMMIDIARNFCADVALRYDFDYLFFIDDDTFPPPDAMKKLVAHDLDVAFGLTFKRGDDYVPCCHTFRNGQDGDAYYPFIAIRDGVHKVDTVGMAATMIRTSVLARIPRPWFEWGQPSMRKIGSNIGEDMQFCERVAKAGMSIHVDTNVICRHRRIDSTYVDDTTFMAYVEATQPEAFKAMPKTKVEVAE